MVVLSNVHAPQEGIRHEEQYTSVYVNDREMGKGTLYITESVLSWINGETGKGFSIEYPQISIHAISRDTQVHPTQCLYIMVDAKVDILDDAIQPSSGNVDEDGDDSESPMTEIRFAPENVSSLEAMFEAMNQCQALYPDPQDSFSDAEEDIYEDAEEEEFEYYEVGAGDSPYILPAEQQEASSNGNGTDEQMDIEAGQFEDAEENP